jgi:site-specific DNA-methyltransferase (adenine-specific)
MEQYLNKVITGNNVEVLRDFPNECIDMVLTSPPYDNLRDYKGYTFDFEGLAKELYRVLKVGGVVVWVVGDAVVNKSETGTSFKQALYFKEIGFNLHDTMIYEKSGIPFPSMTRYNQSFEFMFVFSKGKPKTVNLITDKKNSMAGESRKKIKQRTKNGFSKSEGWTIKDFGIRNNIWKYKTGSNKSTTDNLAYKHPAIFPEQLAQDHINSWSNEGDIVLDPFNGSGTTTKMAKILGRKYIGIDISEEYNQIAEKRLSQDLLF